MLSVNLIEKHFTAKHFDLLVEAVASNGMEMPLPLRGRLGQHPAGGLALGLRRLVELTYGPTSLSHQMTSALLHLQDADGSFGGDPLATACALAALGHLRDEHLPRWREPEAVAAVGVAHERALAALAAMQADDGLFDCSGDRTQQDRALTAAFVLLLLERDERFRQAVRFADLLGWFEQRGDELEPDTRRTWQLARVSAPAIAQPNRAVAAIAA